jgi:hypothetical protein
LTASALPARALTAMTMSTTLLTSVMSPIVNG